MHFVILQAIFVLSEARNDKTLTCEQKIDGVIQSNTVEGDGNEWQCQTSANKIVCTVNCANGVKPKEMVRRIISQLVIIYIQ